MIVELSAVLQDFPGASNRSRCFTHILNLAAKSIIRQFDLPKSEANIVLDEAAKELAKLAAELEHEELMSCGSPGGEGEDDDSDGWVDEKALLSDDEREELTESVKPVRLMLVKVSPLPASFFGVLVNHVATTLPASQTCICDEELDHNPPSERVLDSGRSQTRDAHDAPGCRYPVELNI
jgi:hypothetical protein